MLGRDTEWRQGSVLTHADASALGVIHDDATHHRAVVISHDCDLPNDKEQAVEVIVGSVVNEPNPMLCRARSPRQLHLVYPPQEHSSAVCIELAHADRKQIAKADFANAQGPDQTLILPDEEKRGLKQWLAARYGRPAFPNAFESRLRVNGLERAIAKVLEKESTHLVGVFFDLGQDRARELPEGEAYALRISIVYDAAEGAGSARAAAERCAAKIAELFYSSFGALDVATAVALESCTAVADTLMSLADIRRVDQWRVEYISLRESPLEDFIGLMQ